jgi:hypothetical protein
MPSVRRGNARVNIFEKGIDSLFLPGGDADKFSDQLTRKIFYRSIQNAPKRSGELAAGHRLGGALYRGKRLTQTLLNVSDHAAAVHNGTVGADITPKVHEFMPVPRVRGAFSTEHPRSGAISRFPAKRVRGQVANPWIAKAAAEIIATVVH